MRMSNDTIKLCRLQQSRSLPLIVFGCATGTGQVSNLMKFRNEYISTENSIHLKIYILFVFQLYCSGRYSEKYILIDLISL